MSSTTASEVLPQSTTSTLRDLLVLWQNRDTRAIDVIGRLQLDHDQYTFCYSRRAAHVEGFRPLPGLRDTTRTYRSEVLFPLFAQRVMDPARPGYERYISRLGLSPDESTPWEQIVRSGGRREGDTLQFLPVPEVRDGVVRSNFLAHGVRWIATKELKVVGAPLTVDGAQQERALATLHPGDALGLLPEPGNPSSPLATLITARGVPVGYVPEVLTAGIRQLGDSARVRVLRVNGPDAPPHLRLVVELQARVPDGFSFDPSGDWEPAAEGE